MHGKSSVIEVLPLSADQQREEGREGNVGCVVMAW